MSEPGVKPDDGTVGEAATPSVGMLAVRDAVALPPAHLPQPEFFPSGGEQLAAGVDCLRVLHSLRRRWLPTSLLGMAVAALAAAPV